MFYLQFFKISKLLHLLQFKLIFLTLIASNSMSAQTKGVLAPIISLDFDTRLSFSPMAGLNWYYLNNNDFPTLFYNQVLLRYSIPNNSVGAQANVGFSLLFVGIRTGLTYEYSLDFDKSNLAQAVLLGFDILGFLSVMGGINYSYIRGTDSKRASFTLNATFPILFNTYKEYKVIKSKQLNK